VPSVVVEHLALPRIEQDAMPVGLDPKRQAVLGQQIGTASRIFHQNRDSKTRNHVQPNLTCGDIHTDGNRLLAERVNPAGSHRAVTTADPKLAKTALRLLRIEPIPGDGDLGVTRQIDHLLRSCIE
jgi:hypothetical protein